MNSFYGFSSVISNQACKSKQVIFWIEWHLTSGHTHGGYHLGDYGLFMFQIKSLEMFMLRSCAQLKCI